MKTLTKATLGLIASEATKLVAMGEDVKKVAHKFGITEVTLLRYVKKYTVENPMPITQRPTQRIDARHLSDDQRMALRTSALDSIKQNKNTIASTARNLGVAQLTVRRWLENDTTEYQKRGRKPLNTRIDIRTLAPVDRLALGNKVLEMAKNGDSPKRIADTLHINTLLVNRWIKEGVRSNPRGRKPHSTEVTQG